MDAFVDDGDGNIQKVIVNNLRLIHEIKFFFELPWILAEVVDEYTVELAGMQAPEGFKCTSMTILDGARKCVATRTISWNRESFSVSRTTDALSADRISRLVSTVKRRVCDARVNEIVREITDAYPPLSPVQGIDIFDVVKKSQPKE